MKDIHQQDLYLPARNPRITRALLAHYPRSRPCGVNGPLRQGRLGRPDQETEIHYRVDRESGQNRAMIERIE
jgi:hypothetical protein